MEMLGYLHLQGIGIEVSCITLQMMAIHLPNEIITG